MFKIKCAFKASARELLCLVIFFLPAPISFLLFKAAVAFWAGSFGTRTLPCPLFLFPHYPDLV